MKSLVYICLSVFFLGLACAQLNSNITEIKKYPDSCTSAKPKKNGIYKIQVNGQVWSVYCDVQTAGSPWLVIQRRTDVSMNFYRNWSSYQEGFGDLDGNYFIGLNKLYTLTVSRPHELYIYLEDFDGERRYAKYDRFAIGNDANLYRLNLLGNYVGTAGDALRYHQNGNFSTYDRENGYLSRKCAAQFTGAWWYKDCHYSNLNGLYLGGIYENHQRGRGVNWSTWRGDFYSFKFVRMMIRPT